MSNCQPQPQEGGERSLRRSYLRALGWVMAVWLVAFLLTLLFCVVAGIGGLARTEIVVISVASAVIAWISMLPGLLMLAPQHRSGSASAGMWQSLVLALFIGMAIRLIGTVALFLTCRYHMATSTDMIAGLTIGWYVLLTSLEVFVLARELPKTAKAPNFPETSLG